MTSDFFNRFSGPLDLSNGEPLTVAPLRDVAAVLVASEVIVILPEQESLFPEVQDLKVINLRVLADHLDEQGVDIDYVYEDGKIKANELAIIEQARAIDRADEDADVLPPGVMILRHGASLLIGRTTSPELRLNPEVSNVQTNLINTQNGLVITDMKSVNGTVLLLTPEDASRELPDYEEQFVDDKLRDIIYDSFKAFDNGSGVFQFELDGLHVSGTISASDGETKPLLEVLVLEANDYPDLKAPNGYVLRRLSIDPANEGIKVIDLPAGGSGQLIRASQLREFEAKQALQIAEFIKTNQ